MADDESFYAPDGLPREPEFDIDDEPCVCGTGFTCFANVHEEAAAESEGKP